MTLLQESALLHIIIYIYILATVFNILGIFFGNEVIKYFELENKYPKLHIFFKLRAKFQRYYLFLIFFTLFLVCALGIFLDFLVFF